MSVYKRACDLAGEVFPVSKNVILQTARKHGIASDDTGRLGGEAEIPAAAHRADRGSRSASIGGAA
jgi:hypothetical protein